MNNRLWTKVAEPTDVKVSRLFEKAKQKDKIYYSAPKDVKIQLKKSKP
jgi:hypothetical protein